MSTFIKIALYIISTLSPTAKTDSKDVITSSKGVIETSWNNPLDLPKYEPECPIPLPPPAVTEVVKIR
jgi:hypothetical protein